MIGAESEGDEQDSKPISHHYCYSFAILIMSPHPLSLFFVHVTITGVGLLKSEI